MAGVGHRPAVCTYGLAPNRTVIPRATDEPANLTIHEAGFSNVPSAVDNVLGTALIFGTQGRTVREDKVCLGVATYVAHNVTIALLAVFLSDDGILVAIAGLDARIVRLLAHQGTYDNFRNAIEVDGTAFGKAVEQFSAATQTSGKSAHPIDTADGREGAVLDAETLHRTDDVVEESQRFVIDQ